MHAAPQDTAPVDVRAIRRHFTFPELGRIVTNINLDGRDPVAVAEALNRAGVEARAGCHCATLAHHALGLSPPASCRLSFYLYNTQTRSIRPWRKWRPSPPGAKRQGALVPASGQGATPALRALACSGGSPVAYDAEDGLDPFDHRESRPSSGLTSDGLPNRCTGR